jgi:hypothetical protein
MGKTQSGHLWQGIAEASVARSKHLPRELQMRGFQETTLCREILEVMKGFLESTQEMEKAQGVTNGRIVARHKREPRMYEVLSARPVTPKT